MVSSASQSDTPEAVTPERPANGGSLRNKFISLSIGIAAAVLMVLLLPDSLAHEGKLAAGVATLMAVWWATEAIPLPATALLPLVLFPVLLGADIVDVAAPYASDTIFLFMGGFMLALAMQRWNLHRRIALAVVVAVGTSPTRLIGGFMLATFLITMWVSNTATALMMLPIGVAVIGMVAQMRDGKTDTNFATALMLSIAYTASIGSVSTLISTPPNVLMAAYLANEHDIHIGFAQWMLVGMPLAATFLVIAWIVLTKLVFPPKIKDLNGGRELIREELRAMGRITVPEILVLLTFVAAAVSWVTVPLLAEGAVGEVLPFLAHVSDAGIAMTVAVALFLIPAGGGNNTRLLDWDTAVQLPWGILLLFGGGLSLSAQFTETGLSEWIGDQVQVLGGVPVWVLVFVVTLMVLALTELTSNTATAATFLPVMGGVAVGLGIDVMTLVIPAALAASMSFMMPVGTPPNAVVFGSGHVTIGQMIRGGLWLNVAALFMIMLIMYTIAGRVLGFTL